jgi:hypothetical protein
MPKNSVATMHAARCTQSHIIYRCDLQRSASANIHLGILIELAGSDWHSLGVAMRTELSSPEIAALAPAWRDRLSCPFKYFEVEFERAWHQAPCGYCIDLLASEYGASLLVEPPSHLQHQRVVQAGDCETEEAVRLHVFRMLDAEAKRFLNQSKSTAVIVESEAAHVTAA